tara:strand:+ start:169 stop:489 length:321 start_codon:yes stop_codon:yes gene_type:complete
MELSKDDINELSIGTGIRQEEIKKVLKSSLFKVYDETMSKIRTDLKVILKEGESNQKQAVEDYVHYCSSVVISIIKLAGPKGVDILNNVNMWMMKRVFKDGNIQEP